MRRDVFQAIADPIRREIIQIIAEEPLNLNMIAEKFEISRPAISRHIKVLSECGLIDIKQQGRERYCQANLESLGKVSLWVDQYKIFWTSKLNAVDNFLNNNSEDHNNQIEKKDEK